LIDGEPQVDFFGFSVASTVFIICTYTETCYFEEIRQKMPNISLDLHGMRLEAILLSCCDVHVGLGN
jgi:hypothetical protein